MSRNGKIVKFSEKLHEYEAGVSFEKRADGVCVLTGAADSWDKVVGAGMIAQKSGLFTGVVNNVKLRGVTEPPMTTPSFSDEKYNGMKTDVLVIGGGVVGCAILRELSALNISCALAEKENDLGTHASMRNDGMVHVGMDIPGKPLKFLYMKRGNIMFDKLCSELQVKFYRNGQYVMFGDSRMKALIPPLWIRVRRHGIGKFRYVGQKEMRRKFPNISKKVKFALFFPETGTVCPYGLTVALAENAVMNGAAVLLETAVTGMKTEKGEIKSVMTNRGEISAKVVINAAGVFCDKVADMAGDRFYTVHPRKGTSIITDKSFTDKIVRGNVALLDNRLKSDKKSHTKGGGIVLTSDGNLLIGPDAHEVYAREDYSVDIDDVKRVLKKQSVAVDEFPANAVINYFSGIRASLYNEDFIVEKGRAVKNIIHVAGIQSPGLTAAPAIAQDVAVMAKELLEERGEKVEGKAFDPIRKAPPRLAEMPLCDREKYIKENPDYGRIVCRCEEVSAGEIKDALKSVIPPVTVDGVKRRVRAGMGRCQGGFCQPYVLEIMHEVTGKEYTEIPKKGEGVIITETK